MQSIGDLLVRNGGLGITTSSSGLRSLVRSRVSSMPIVTARDCLTQAAFAESDPSGYLVLKLVSHRSVLAGSRPARNGE